MGLKRTPMTNPGEAVGNPTTHPLLYRQLAQLPPDPERLMLTLTNQSGAAVSAGTVVVASPNPLAFATSSTEDDGTVLGIAAEDIAASAQGKIIVAGRFRTLLAIAGVTAGQFLRQSTTLGQVGGTANPTRGTFAISLTSRDATTLSVDALLIGLHLPAGPSFTGITLTAGELQLANNRAVAWRNAANSAYINGILLNTNDDLLLGTTTVGDIILNSTRMLWAKGADIASAATITPGSDGNYFAITGTTGITAIASMQAGSIVIFRFDGALTITHNATSLILQGATNLTTAAGDIVAFISEGAGNWREAWRRLATAASSGMSRAGGSTTEQTTSSTTAVDLVTISGLSIAVGTPVRVVLNFRKTTGASASVFLGLTLNATEVIVPRQVTAVVTGPADEAASGFAVFEFIYGRTNYLQSGWMTWHANATGNGGGDSYKRPFTVNMPTATLTSIIIRGRTDSALITLGVQDVQVYTGAVS